MTNLSVPGVVAAAAGKTRRWLQRGGDGAAAKPGAPAAPSGGGPREGQAVNRMKRRHETACRLLLSQQPHLAMLSATSCRVRAFAACFEPAAASPFPGIPVSAGDAGLQGKLRLRGLWFWCRLYIPRQRLRRPCRHQRGGGANRIQRRAALPCFSLAFPLPSPCAGGGAQRCRGCS